MASSGTYVVPKTGISASVLMHGRQLREVEIFLSESSPTHTGAERASDLLGAGSGFIPVRRAGSSQVFLVRREAIMVITVSALDETVAEGIEEGILESDAARTERLEVVLADGSSVRGEICYVMPEGHRRVQDYLNLPEGVFKLRDDDRIHIVSKRHVGEIRILSASSRG